MTTKEMEIVTKLLQDSLANQKGDSLPFKTSADHLQWQINSLQLLLRGADEPVKPKRVKPKSRSARWGEAASAASAALTDLKDIQQEFQDWMDNLPENLQSSNLADKLQTVCDLDIEGAQSTIEEAEGADLPLGFGRD
jgi:hypothetical protein